MRQTPTFSYPNVLRGIMSCTIEPPVNGDYRKVLLKNLVLWRKCTAAESEKAAEWSSDYGAQFVYSIPYPVMPLPAQSDLIRFHLILAPDGSIWKEGSLYLLECALNGAQHPTISGIAGDLCSFANALLHAGKNIWDFSGPKATRPTYFVKSVFKKRVMENPNCTGTENRKINRMVDFYKHHVERGFKPEQEMWKTRKIRIRFEDKHGFSQQKEVESTDLTFKTVKENYNLPSGKYVVDGGKLYPIGKGNQEALIDALATSGHQEMLLAHIVALTGGPRMQTIFTMRHSCIKKDAEDRLILAGFDAGGDTMIDTKHNKKERINLPEWVHLLIADYLESDRYKIRAAKSIIGTTEDQYVFLTETGRPYYVGKKDQAIFGSTESGSAIRKFQKETLKKILKKSGNFFKYRFHDLRATFGMNLLEGLKKNNVSELAALDTLRNRLNHASVETTKRYANFKPTKEQRAAAQSEYEDHIRLTIDIERLRHGTPRAHDT